MPGLKTALCTPKRHLTNTFHFSALIGVAAALRDRGHEVLFFQPRPSALLEHTRSAIASDAHDWGAAVQLFIDDDVVPLNPHSVARLVEAAAELESLVAAPTLIGGGERYNLTFLEENPFDPPRLVKAAHCGMGLTAISREVFNNIIVDSELEKVTFVAGQPRIWPFFRSILTADVWMGEDTSFTMRACEAMRTDHVWADTRCLPQHWGYQPY